MLICRGMQMIKQRKIEKRIQETINAIGRQESRESVAIITSHPRKMADSREAGKSNIKSSFVQNQMREFLIENLYLL